MPRRPFAARILPLAACAAATTAACADVPKDQDDAGGDAHFPPLTDRMVLGDAPTSPPQDAGPDTDADAGQEIDAAPAFAVRITAPAEGTVVGGDLTIVVEVAENILLRGVEFYAGGERYDADLRAPYESRLDTTRLPDGPATVRATAVALNDLTASADVDVVVDNTPPEIHLLSPLPDQAVFYDPEGFDVVFELADVSPIESATAALNGVPLVLAPPAPGEPWRTHVDFDTFGVDPVQLPLDLALEISAADARFLVQQSATHHRLRSRVDWSFQTLGEIWSTPTVGPDGTVYFGSNDHTFFALHPDGSEAWRFDAGAEVPTRAALGPDGALYFGAGSRVFSLDPAGTRRWFYEADASVASSPALSPDGASVYFGTYGARVVSLRASDGGFNWGVPTQGEVLSSPVVGADGAVYIGSHDHWVRAIEAGGSERWHFETGGEIWGRPLITAAGILVVGSNDGYLYGLSLLDGGRRWERDLRGEIWGGPAEGADGTLYVGSTFRRVRALDPNGEPRWEVETGGLAQSIPAVDAQGIIYIGSTDRMVYAISPQGEVLWRYETEAEILGSPALSADQSAVYVGSVDRRLYALATGHAPVQCPEPEMVELGGQRIMKYEASRPDATEASPGRAASGACSRAGVLPWTGISATDAASMCERSGLVLCASSAWLAACIGPEGADYPYGAELDPEACNGAENSLSGCDSGACGALATGAAVACISPQGAFDLSGNVREWTSDPSPVLGAEFQIVRGGSFRRGGVELRCTFELAPSTHLPVATQADDLGFRCCAAVDPAAPPPD